MPPTDTEREPSVPDTPADSPEDLIELPDEIAAALQTVGPTAAAQTPSEPDEEAPASGQSDADDEPPSDEAPSDARDLEDSDLPDDHPAIKRARIAQREADRRNKELAAQLNQLQEQLHELRDREANEAARAEQEEYDRLLESDDPEDIERLHQLQRERRRQEKAEEPVRRTAYAERDREQLTFSYVHRETLYPDLSEDDLNSAITAATQLAAQQNRRPLPAEVYAVIAQSRVDKLAAAKDGELTKLKESNKTLTERVKALEAELSGNALDGDDGPDEPAVGGAPAGDIFDRLERISVSELAANPEKYRKQVERAASR